MVRPAACPSPPTPAPSAFDLHGTGTQTGLGATPSALAFGDRADGANKTLSVSIANTGTSAVTITGSTPPAAPFTATGFPANGSTLAAGASVSVSVTYTPTRRQPGLQLLSPAAPAR